MDSLKRSLKWDEEAFGLLEDICEDFTGLELSDPIRRRCAGGEQDEAGRRGTQHEVRVVRRNRRVVARERERARHARIAARVPGAAASRS